MQKPKSSKGTILIVDDTLSNLRVLSTMLRKSGYEVHDAINGSAALALAEEQPPDLIMLDIRMPEMDGYEVCRRLKANPKTCGVPVIFLSALNELADKVKGFTAGGVDYITKPFRVQDVLMRVETHLTLSVLRRQLEARNVQLAKVNQALEHEIAERQQAEAALQQVNQELEQRVAERTADLVRVNADLKIEIARHQRTAEERAKLLAQVQDQMRRVQQIINIVPEGVFLLDADHHIIMANPLAQRDLATLASAQVGDVITCLGGRPLEELLTSPPKGLWHTLEVKQSPAESTAREVIQYYQILARPIETSPDNEGWVFVIRDMTQQHDMERQIRQQERLAAVGRVAAGIAHDFNNIMATIILYTQMATRIEGLSKRDQERLAIIHQQADQATRLARQILDFSRGVELKRSPLDFCALLQDHVQLIATTLPDTITLELACNLERDFIVTGDATRLQQVLSNLTVNARDAMPEGGRLSFELERIHVATLKDVPLLEMTMSKTTLGHWVKLSVSDTGLGIPSDVLPHIYEPFFSTKAPGQGTGLGLAQVHGIINAHGGYIDVNSQVGRGTTFILYLPVSNSK